MKVVSGKTLFGTLRRWLIDNELEIWRRGQPVTSLPILVLIVLVLFCSLGLAAPAASGPVFWLPVSDLGPDLEDETINGVMAVWPIPPPTWAAR